MNKIFIFWHLLYKDFSVHTEKWIERNKWLRRKYVLFFCVCSHKMWQFLGLEAAECTRSKQKERHMYRIWEHVMLKV
jgi:hypothetical protein